MKIIEALRNKFNKGNSYEPVYNSKGQHTTPAKLRQEVMHKHQQKLYLHMR
jgi:hypothetical protein